MVSLNCPWPCHQKCALLRVKDLESRDELTDVIQGDEARLCIKLAQVSSQHPFVLMGFGDLSRLGNKSDVTRLEGVEQFGELKVMFLHVPFLGMEICLAT